jgi:hypothetical protein
MARLKIKPQGRCVFCGRPGVTKEHVWPTWTHSFLYRDAKPINVRASFTIDTKIPAPSLDQRRDKEGDVHTLQVRVVCREHCNGGWMSRLETAAKPILLPLMTGQSILIGHQEQKILAAWIAKTAMMLEFADYKRVSTSPMQRRFLMDRLEPPEGWKIYIAQYQGQDWKAKAFRASTAFSIVMGKIQVIDRQLRPSMNTQSITFGIGQLLVQLVSSTVPLLIIEPPPEFLPYTPQIWPFKKSLIWPSSHILNDADARILTNGLSRMLRNDPDFIEPWPG